MADQANIVGKVAADTASGVASMNALKRAADATGTGFQGFAAKASSALDTAAVGLAKFNLALGGVQKAFQLLEGAVALVKFSAESKQLESRFKELGLSSQKLTGAVGGSVDKMTLMKFALRQVQGESALTASQMELVLKAAETLNDKGFGDTIEIAEAMAKALKGGSTRALLEYNIKVEETGSKQKDLNGLMDEFARIANNPPNVNPQLEAIERLQAATTDWLNDMKSGIGSLLMMAAQLADSMSDQIAGVKKGTSIQLDPEAWARLSPAERQAEIAALRARQATFGQANPNAKKITTWSGDFTDATSMPSDEKAKKAAAARGGSRGAGQSLSMTGGMDFGMFFDDLASPGSSIYGASDDAELAGLMDGATQTAGMSDAERLASIVQGRKDAAAEVARLNQEQIDNNLALAASESVKYDAINNSTMAFYAMSAAIAEGANPFGAFIKAGAQLMKAQAIRDSALALSAVAQGLFGINPTGNFAAAAAFAKSAAANAAGAVLLGAMGGSGSSGGGASASSPAAGGFAGQSITSNPEQGGGVTIIVDGNLYGEPAAFGRAVVDGMEAAARSGRTRLRTGNRWS